jgi:hypothetical protein
VSDDYPPSQDQPSQYGDQPPQDGPVLRQPSQGDWPSQEQDAPNAVYSGGAKKKINGMGCIGLILGLVGFSPFVIGIIGKLSLGVFGSFFLLPLGSISAILGIIFSEVSLLRTQNGYKWLAVAGLVLSIIATILTLLPIVFFLFLVLRPRY